MKKTLTIDEFKIFVKTRNLRTVHLHSDDNNRHGKLRYYLTFDSITISKNSIILCDSASNMEFPDVQKVKIDDSVSPFYLIITVISCDYKGLNIEYNLLAEL